MGKELAKRDESLMLANVESVKALTTSIKESLAGERLTPLDLTNVGMPTGGGKYWTIPTMENPDGEPFQKIEGVILHAQNSRKFWMSDFEDGTGDEPDCKSDDAIVGQGDPGGLCDECQYSEWGSGRGNSQACTLNKNLFILTRREMLPIRLVLSPGSLRNAKQYFLQLASRQVHFANVLTEISLEVTQNKEQIKYSRAVFRCARPLEEDELAKVAEYREAIVPSLAVVQAD